MLYKSMVYLATFPIMAGYRGKNADSHLMFVASGSQVEEVHYPILRKLSTLKEEMIPIQILSRPEQHGQRMLSLHKRNTVAKAFEKPWPSIE